MASIGHQRFLNTTRGQIVAMLRRKPQTVEDLRHGLNLTDNAVRAHLAGLERDGMIRQQGLRRGPGAGKPAAVYEINTDAELMLSRAYAPLLGALLDELSATRSQVEAESLMEAAGHRLGSAVPRNAGDSIDTRAENAAAVLNSLGGDAQVERSEGRITIRGCGCPLGAVTGRRPEVCKAVQALVSDIMGAPVSECCDRGQRPQCRFEVSTAA